jgi:chemotaxis protein methyltransferase CheR
MRALGLQDYSQYCNFLKEDTNELQKLLRVLTINLSYFFRNFEVFEYLKKEIFKEFTEEQSYVFWSAGCAQGEEPYSLAIVTEESGIAKRVKIYGTDIDDTALNKAKEGVYSEVSFQYTPADIKNKYFTKVDGCYKINEAIRRGVQFLNLDLFDPPEFGPCDLILCRNVLIYLDRKAQSIVLRNFCENLKPGRFLVFGMVELLLGIPEMKLFEVINHREHVYRKLS